MIRLTTGWVLLIGGIILGPVPIFPGFVLVIPGLTMVAAESRWVRGWLRRLREQRHIRRAMREAEKVGLKLDLDQDHPDQGDSGESPTPPET
jgi:hypothetical protein